MTRKPFFALLILLIMLFGAESKAQIYSEAPLRISGDSVLTNMMYVKFRSNDVVVLPTDSILIMPAAIMIHLMSKKLTKIIFEPNRYHYLTNIFFLT